MEKPVQLTEKFESSGRRLVSRVLSAAILSLAYAFSVYKSEVGQGLMGKSAYLAGESVRYDKFLVHPQVDIIVAGFVMIYISFGIYELLAFVIYQVIARLPRKEEAGLTIAEVKQ
jgi:hypothetical protein